MKKIIENVIFLQGDNATEALNILDNKGEKAALEYLKQWHYPGEHEELTEQPHGNNDCVFESAGYSMAYNTNIGYIGLTFTFKDEA
jgi:hypothetical protein